MFYIYKDYADSYSGSYSQACEYFAIRHADFDISQVWLDINE